MADTNVIRDAAIELIPEVFSLIRESFRRSHPNDPQPSDADVAAGLRSAIDSSEAKDEAWLRAHPPE